MAMNAELRRRMAGSLLPAASNVIDNRAPVRGEAGPRALIYRPARSAMTSGRGGTRRWLLEFEPRSPPFIEPLMGWTGSTDPLAGLRLTFSSRETAMRFAERQGIACEVHAPADAARRPAAVPRPSAPPPVPAHALPGPALTARAA